MVSEFIGNVSFFIAVGTETMPTSATVVGGNVEMPFVVVVGDNVETSFLVVNDAKYASKNA